jgi:hypothetical protein
MKITIGTKNSSNREVKSKEELFDFPVVTVQSKPAASKGSHKIAFNKVAGDMLGITNEDEVSITMSLDNPILLIVTGLDCEKYTIYKKLDFASKPIHDCITKAKNSNSEIDNHFRVNITEVDYDEIKLKAIEILELVTPVNKIEAHDCCPTPNEESDI